MIWALRSGLPLLRAGLPLVFERIEQYNRAQS